jgi:hypothetical protein
VEDSSEWTSTVTDPEENGTNLCKGPDWKPLFIALYIMYTLALKGIKKHIFNNTSQTTKKSDKSVPTSAAVKLTPEAVLTCNFVAPLTVTDMDTEFAGAENTVPEQGTDRKRGRPPPITMDSTTNLIRLQSD